MNMPIPGKELQRQFRERMYAKGYRQKTVWVVQDKAKPLKLERKAFHRKLDELTLEWDTKDIAKLYADIIKAVKKRREELQGI